MDNIAYILEGAKGISNEEFVDYSNPPSTEPQPRQLVVQPREVTAAIVTPKVLEDINRLYQLVSHRDSLHKNTSVTMSIAQEMFALLPGADKREISKCTVAPSKANYLNITGIVESSIEQAMAELVVLFKSSYEVFVEQRDCIRSANVIQSLLKQIEAYVHVNKTKIDKLLKDRTIVYLRTKEFVKADEIPIADFHIAPGDIIDWEKADLFLAGMHNLKELDLAPVLLNIFSETPTLRSVFAKMVDIAENQEANERQLDGRISAHYERTSNLDYAISKNKAELSEISAVLHEQDALSPLMDALLALLDENVLKAFFKATDTILKAVE